MCSDSDTTCAEYCVSCLSANASATRIDRCCVIVVPIYVSMCVRSTAGCWGCIIRPSQRSHAIAFLSPSTFTANCVPVCHQSDHTSCGAGFIARCRVAFDAILSPHTVYIVCVCVSRLICKRTRFVSSPHVCVSLIGLEPPPVCAQITANILLDFHVTATARHRKPFYESD